METIQHYRYDDVNLTLSQKPMGSSPLYLDGLVQERRNSSALAMELRLSCINPSIPSGSWT